MFQHRRCLHDGIGQQRHRHSVEGKPLPRLRMLIGSVSSLFVLMNPSFGWIKLSWKPW